MTPGRTRTRTLDLESSQLKDVMNNKEVEYIDD